MAGGRGGHRPARRAPREIETDKIVIEMESFATGTLVEVVHPAGEDMIAVGEVIGYLDDGN